MNTTVIGNRAEQLVARFLERNGYIVHGTNWKTKRCEIDVVARKDNCMYFVEVKYRATDMQGTGFDYITPQKIRQMRYAAQTWVMANNWRGAYVLSGASVDVRNKIEFIEQL